MLTLAIVDISDNHVVNNTVEGVLMRRVDLNQPVYDIHEIRPVYKLDK